MSRPTQKRALFHPIYWPMWLGIGLFRLLILLPWTVQLWLGRILGLLALLFLRRRRQVVKINLSLCFPKLDETQLKQLASAHHKALGIGLFETCMAWWAPKHRLPKFEIVGREHLEQARAVGKGVILLTAHFTTLEICGRVFSDAFSMGGLFREPDNPVIAREMHRGRIDKMIPAVPMNDLRGLIRALKDGHTIWYAPDQGKKTKFSTILPFFGIPALTNTATSRIAQMTGAAVVPFFGQRHADGSYTLQILPPLTDFPTKDVDADALRINKLMAEYIRLAPEQYFWIHRRFKRRGRDHQNVYPTAPKKRRTKNPKQTAGG